MKLSAMHDLLEQGGHRGEIAEYRRVAMERVNDPLDTSIHRVTVR